MQFTTTLTRNTAGQTRVIYMTNGTLTVRLVRSPQSPLWAFESYDADTDEVPVKGGLFALPSALAHAYRFMGVES